MTERPILFSAPMVRAILAGTKTQTRRVVKPTRGRPIEFLGGGPRGGADWNNPECWGYEWHEGPEFVTLKPMDGQAYPCPYGQPGDRLWVRETFAHIYRDNTKPAARRDDDVAYKADHPGFDEYAYGTWKPSIHMPRWASRITLEITGVRVERLQAISDADLECEGLQETIDAGVDHDGYPRDAWRALWSSINGAESWTANPWVWVVEFRRIQSPA